jgi:hypothetical protein
MLRKLVSTMSLLAALLLSPSIAYSETATQKVGAFTRIVMVKVVLHETQAAVTKACNIQDESNKLVRVLGCWKKAGVGRGTIHAVLPDNWCDINRIETLGHELLHALGKHHGPHYAPPWLQPEAATGCQNGHWWIPPTNPRP